MLHFDISIVSDSEVVPFCAKFQLQPTNPQLGLVNSIELKKKDNLVFHNLDVCYNDVSILKLNGLPCHNSDITLENF